MMPQNVLSSTVEPGNLLAPRNQRLDTDLLIDYEQGGAGLNDASAGLQVQTWTCVCNGHAFTASSPSLPGGSVILNVAGNVVDFGFTFDQLMRVFVAYSLDDGTAHYYWYDSTIPGYTTSALPAGSTFARCSLDDKRPLQSNTSDVILAYTRSGSLYFRMQRDRFLIEYTLAGSLNTARLINVGLSQVNRFQFILKP